MRTIVSKIMVDTAQENKHFIALTGDHGYALFDGIRSTHPSQYLNVGVAEQAMIGIAAGLARSNFLPLVYGLAAFVPLRVVEQIKIDLCTSTLPTIILGDGAGLVYSTLGFSHQCGEDIACLRSLPNINIYTPADAAEFVNCFSEAKTHNGPSYIRIGKADRPELAAQLKNRFATTAPYFTVVGGSSTLLIGHGAMSSVAATIATELGLSALSVPRIKPFPKEIGTMMQPFKHVIVLEEHCIHGGLTSAICEFLCLNLKRLPKMTSIALQDKFTEFAGDYQFALSEHGLSDVEVKEKVKLAIAS